jgi:hypothetical protein
MLDMGAACAASSVMRTLVLPGRDDAEIDAMITGLVRKERDRLPIPLRCPELADSKEAVRRVGIERS